MPAQILTVNTKQSTGAPQPDAVVTARLIPPRDRSTPRTTDGLIVNRTPPSQTTDAAGQAELTLYPTELMSPAGCLWEITIKSGDFTTTDRISMPDEAATLKARVDATDPTTIHHERPTTLTDGAIGAVAFRNSPSDLTDTEKTRVRTNIGAVRRTDTEVGAAAFTNPPAGLTDTQKRVIRRDIGADANFIARERSDHPAIWGTNNAVNVNSNTYAGVVLNGIVISAQSGQPVKIYQRLAGGPPYLRLLGTTQQAITTGDLVNKVFTWAIAGNTGDIPASKLPFNVPAWLRDPINDDIDWTLLNTTLQEFCRNPPEGTDRVLIDRDDLTPEQKLPAALGAGSQLLGMSADGANTEWVDPPDSSPGGGDPDRVLRIAKAQWVLPNAAADHIDDVVIRQRKSGTTSFMSKTGGETIHLDDAFVLQDELRTEYAAVLVADRPSVADADFGKIYGVGPNNEVDELAYKQRVNETVVSVFMGRLRAPSNSPGLISYGFSQVGRSAGWSAGGYISPPEADTATIIELVQYRNVLLAPTIEITVNNAGPLTGHTAAFHLDYRQEGTSTWTRLTLTPTAGFNVPQQKRFSQNGTTNAAFLLTPEETWEFKFPSPTDATQDVILHSVDGIRRIADEGEIEQAKAEATHELATESAAIRAAIPSAPETRAETRWDTPFPGNLTTSPQFLYEPDGADRYVMPSTGRMLIAMKYADGVGSRGGSMASAEVPADFFTSSRAQIVALGQNRGLIITLDAQRRVSLDSTNADNSQIGKLSFTHIT